MPAESSVRHEEWPSFKGLKSRRGVSPADTPAPSISALALLPGSREQGGGSSCPQAGEPGTARASWCRGIPAHF